MQLQPTHKTFLLGLSVSFLILSAFLFGAWADRVFIVKPLDVLTGKIRLPSSKPVAERSSLSDSVSVSETIPDIIDQATPSIVTISSIEERTVTVPAEQGIFGSVLQGVAEEGAETTAGESDIENDPITVTVATSQTQRIQQTLGTGFVIKPGVIVTNRHVVEKVDAEYQISDSYDRQHQVTSVYRHPSIDFAILTTTATDLPVLPLGDSATVRVGEGVIAVGSVLGEFRYSVTTGVVSGLGRGIRAIEGTQVQSLEDAIQTDAAINQGNSGGPLLNMSGKVIGMNVAASNIGQNIGFALPINQLVAAVASVESTESVEGVELVSPSP